MYGKIMSLNGLVQKIDENFRAKVRSEQYGASLTSIIEFITAFSFTMILWYGGYQVMNGIWKRRN